ncbi:MAG: fatty acid oxidation complex subunit alpha FadJ [Aeromonadaceae bacterium]
MSYFTLHEHTDGIVELILDVPGERVNTLQAALIPEFAALLDQIQQKIGVRGLLIRSGKAGSFVAGADLHMLDQCQNESQALALSQQAQQLFNQLAALPCPTVAAIHGTCLGGGLELALACDYRICSQDESTRLGLPEVQLGLIPGSGGTQRLPRLIGLPQALELLLTGRQLDGRQAHHVGLVDALVSEPLLLSAASQLLRQGKPRRHLSWLKRMSLCLPLAPLILLRARKAMMGKTRGNYPAPLALLSVVETGLRHGMVAGLTHESEQFATLLLGQVSANLRALFHAGVAHKKEQLYLGAEPQLLRQVAVLGAGMMGAGIAYVTAAKAGLVVRIKDTSLATINRAMGRCRSQLQKRVNKHQLTSHQSQEVMQRISGGLDYQGFKGMDVVIEAVFEDLSLKQQMVDEVFAASVASTLFASNTSSLPIANIAARSAFPERVVGLHYFSPVEKMPLVEVIPHALTTASTVATVLALARLQGKTPIVVRDVAGFYVNRILAPYMNEAALILAEGETIEDIDEALLRQGFPVGPLALLDEIGLDVAGKIAPLLAEAHGVRFEPPNVLTLMLADGRKGRKSGRGFYTYPASGKKQADGKVYDLLRVLPLKRLGHTVIAERCLLLMLNEAVRALDEGVIASPRDGDLGAVLGIGYPPFCGGPFRHLDHWGLQQVIDKLRHYAQLYGDRFLPCPALLQRAEQGEPFHSIRVDDIPS